MLWIRVGISATYKHTQLHSFLYNVYISCTDVPIRRTELELSGVVQTYLNRQGLVLLGADTPVWSPQNLSDWRISFVTIGSELGLSLKLMCRVYKASPDCRRESLVSKTFYWVLSGYQAKQTKLALEVCQGNPNPAKSMQTRFVRPQRWRNSCKLRKVKELTAWATECAKQIVDAAVEETALVRIHLFSILSCTADSRLCWRLNRTLGTNTENCSSNGAS